jgi:deferrochelatase/peroxidase EfeB
VKPDGRLRSAVEETGVSENSHGPLPLQPAFVQDADPLLDSVGEPSPVIHFGYVDGLSQPRIAGAPWESPAAAPTDDNPLVAPWMFVVSKAAELYRAAPFLCNGSFGAFRLLHQDVGAFERFIASQGADKAELVAAKMCGRWRDGTPLEVSPDRPDPSLSGFELTNFNYLTPTTHQVGARETDDLGALCPYAAHTRRTNPRDDNFVQGNNNPSYPDAEQHRIRRFATPYGPPYTPESAGAQRGLVGWFMCASLVQQFEFVMNTWITVPGGGFRNVDVSPNTSGVDPLFGPQPRSIDPVDGDFDLDYLAGGSYDTVPGLTRFIRTDGGLYGFLPSLTAIRQLSTPPPAPRKKKVPNH